MRLKRLQMDALRERNTLLGCWDDCEPSAIPQAAIDGGMAYDARQPVTANPYEPGTRQHEDWALGYDEMRYQAEYRPETP